MFKGSRSIRNMVILTPLLALPLVMVGCGGSNNSTNANGGQQPSGLTERTIDATAGGLGADASDPANKHTYFNLDTGLVVDLTDTAAKNSTGWHIGFKRTEMVLNGGTSGVGTVMGTVADDQDDFYNAGTTTENSSVFLNATPATELSSITNVSTDTGLIYSSDGNVAQIIGDGGSDSWWLYNPAAFTVSENETSWIIIRSAQGDSYAKFHVTDIVQATRDITVEFFIQNSGNAAFSLTPVNWVAAIGAGGGSKCYDIDTSTEVDCTTQAANWDLQIEISTDGRSWNMWTNGGVRGSGTSGASFGTLTKTQADTFVASTTAGLTFSADASSGVFKQSSWYAYNLQNGHKLWPNYRVYIVDTGTNKYKLQITSYYDNAGTSGMVNIRYAQF